MRRLQIDTDNEGFVRISIMLDGAVVESFGYLPEQARGLAALLTAEAFRAEQGDPYPSRWRGGNSRSVDVGHGLVVTVGPTVGT